MTASEAVTHPAAVMFDMDGLLVDTEPQWLAAEQRTVAALGAEWSSKQQLDLIGSNLWFAAEYMVRHAGSDRPPTEVMELLLANMSEELQRGVIFRPGALELVAALEGLETPMALVTSSVRVHVDVVLGQLPGTPFKHVVTADDVQQFKPHPEPYLTALDLLGVEAARTVVLEDSPAGVTSAEAAGCHVVAVPSVIPIGPGDRRSIHASLLDVTPEVLAAAIAR